MRALALLVLLPAIAAADRQLAPAAKVHLDAGLAAYDKQDWDTAIKEIEQAYGLDHDPSLLYTWAQAERNGKRCAKAIEHYRAFLDANPPEGQATVAARSNIELCVASLKLQACEADLHTQPAAPHERVIRESGDAWYASPGVPLLAVGVIGVGVGTGYLIAAAGSHDRADHAATRQDAIDALDEATTRRRIGIASVSLGAALAVGGIAYIVVTRPKRTTMGVTATTSGVGMVIGGAW